MTSILRLTALVAIVVASNTAIGSLATESTLVDQTYCRPVIPKSVPRASGDVFSTADSLFKRGKYSDSARAYYQTFLCPADPLYLALDPHAFDHGLVKPFSEALTVAIRGDYKSAAADMEGLKARLPDFTQAGFLAGNLNWASGNRNKALDDWQATITGPFVSVPQGSDQSQRAASAMLRWARSHFVR